MHSVPSQVLQPDPVVIVTRGVCRRKPMPGGAAFRLRRNLHSPAHGSPQTQRGGRGLEPKDPHTKVLSGLGDSVCASPSVISVRPRVLGRGSHPPTQICLHLRRTMHSTWYDVLKCLFDSYFSIYLIRCLFAGLLRTHSFFVRL